MMLRHTFVVVRRVPVSGQVSPPMKNHFRMADRSYVIPVSACIHIRRRSSFLSSPQGNQKRFIGWEKEVPLKKQSH